MSSYQNDTINLNGKMMEPRNHLKPIKKFKFAPNSYPVISADERIFAASQDSKKFYLQVYSSSTGKIVGEKALEAQQLGKFCSRLILFYDKIAASFENQRKDAYKTLIININTLVVEQELDFLVESVIELGSGIVAFVHRKRLSERGLYDPFHVSIAKSTKLASPLQTESLLQQSLLELANDFSFPPQLCALSESEFVTINDHALSPHLKQLSVIYIWKRENSTQWNITKIIKTPNKNIKIIKYNELQAIIISQNGSSLEIAILDTQDMSIQPIATKQITTSKDATRRVEATMLTTQCLLYQTPSGKFFRYPLKEELSEHKSIPVQLKHQEEERCIFPSSPKRNLLFFRHNNDHTQVNLFDLSALYVDRLNEDDEENKARTVPLSLGFQRLPQGIINIIIDYYLNGDKVFRIRPTLSYSPTPLASVSNELKDSKLSQESNNLNLQSGLFAPLIEKNKLSQELTFLIQPLENYIIHTGKLPGLTVPFNQLRKAFAIIKKQIFFIAKNSDFNDVALIEKLQVIIDTLDVVSYQARNQLNLSWMWAGMVFNVNYYVKKKKDKLKARVYQQISKEFTEELKEAPPVLPDSSSVPLANAVITEEELKEKRKETFFSLAHAISNGSTYSVDEAKLFISLQVNRQPRKAFQQIPKSQAADQKSNNTHEEINPKKIAAFRKIYCALRDAQTGWGWLKTNFLADKKDDESLSEEIIKAHIATHQGGRAEKAWALVEKYYPNCTSKDIDLVKEIYQWAFDQSVFSRSQLFGTGCQTLFSKRAVRDRLQQQGNMEKIIEDHESSDTPYSRTATIRRHLLS